MIVATAGHVDHGKTSLIRALTGVDTDRLPEEKRRGLTIDLGFAYYDLGDGEKTGFVDVPGHERFVRTMVAGVSSIDAVMFIVAADDGPMPQTTEHLAILDLLGVDKGIFVISKIDRVDEKRTQEVALECEKLLVNKSLQSAHVLKVCALDGRGISELKSSLLNLRKKWRPRKKDGCFRLAVDRSFVLKGTGRVVTGTVFSGQIGADENVVYAPGDGAPLRVRGIHAQNALASIAVAGQRAALNVTSSEGRSLAAAKGGWIVGQRMGFSTRRFDARIKALGDEEKGLRNRMPVHVHIGSADVTGRINLLEKSSVEPGCTEYAEVILDRPVHTVRGDKIVLRDQSARRTIGGGVVLDSLIQTQKRSKAERLFFLKSTSNFEAEDAFAFELAHSTTGVSLSLFKCNWNRTQREMDKLVKDSGAILVAEDEGNYAYDKEKWSKLKKSFLELLGQLHSQTESKESTAPERVNRKIPNPLRKAGLKRLIDDLVNERYIERSAGGIQLPGTILEMSTADKKLWDQVKPLLDRADFKIPVVRDMADTLRMNVKLLEGFLKRAIQYELVIKVSDKRYYLTETIDVLKKLVRKTSENSGNVGFSVAEFRNDSGIGRNAVVEILEYFDRVGFTKRLGQVRKLLDLPKR